MWWNSSELSVQQRSPGLGYLLRVRGFLAFCHSGVGDGVFSPLLHAWRSATSNARGPVFFSFGGARSLRRRSAVRRVTAYPKEQSGNLERWMTRDPSGMPSRRNKACVKGCRLYHAGRVGSWYRMCGIAVRLKDWRSVLGPSSVTTSK